VRPERERERDQEEEEEEEKEEEKKKEGVLFIHTEGTKCCRATAPAPTRCLPPSSPNLEPGMSATLE
jgi:hypothetical protein